MRKSLIIMIVMIAAIMYAVPVFAVTGICNIASVVTSTTIGGSTFNPSNGVSITVSSNTTNYTASSAHGSSAGTAAGYEFMILNTNNGMLKKQWASGTAPAACSATPTWPEPVTTPTATITGFQ